MEEGVKTHCQFHKADRLVCVIPPDNVRPEVSGHNVGRKTVVVGPVNSACDSIG